MKWDFARRLHLLGQLQKAKKAFYVVPTGFLLFFLTGCGGSALHESFNDYAEVYAVTQNQQMLINLARLANRHPAYFLQMGTITSTFQFTSQLGGNGAGQANHQLTNNYGGAVTAAGFAAADTVANMTTYGANAVLGANEQPTFSYTPLSGSSYAQAVLVPIGSNVFYTLYEQGFPVDQLLRAMVQSIDFFDPRTGVTISLVNDPDKDRPDNFQCFLRMAGLARELQLNHRLHVATTSSITPAPSPVFSEPKVEETLKAAQQGFVLQETAPGSGKYSLAQLGSITAFKLEPGSTQFIDQLRKDKYFRIEGDKPQDSNGSDASDKKEAASSDPKAQPSMSIRLRPFLGVLDSLATEEEVFDELAKRPGFLDGIPPSQRQPILRITWNQENAKPETPLVTTNYRGKHYLIADASGSTWNRDVFILVNYLNSQIALDPKNLPVQQLIQVH